MHAALATDSLPGVAARRHRRLPADTRAVDDARPHGANWNDNAGGGTVHDVAIPARAARTEHGAVPRTHGSGAGQGVARPPHARVKLPRVAPNGPGNGGEYVTVGHARPTDRATTTTTNGCHAGASVSPAAAAATTAAAATAAAATTTGTCSKATGQYSKPEATKETAYTLHAI